MRSNGQSTWGLPMHMGGVRQAARCPYGAAEPSWAMVRCISSSHPPMLYTSCVGLLQLLTHNQLGHSARISAQPPKKPSGFRLIEKTIKVYRTHRDAGKFDCQFIRDSVESV